MDMDTWLNGVDLNVKRYASKGLKVTYTEVDGFIKMDDIDFQTAAGREEYDNRLQWQAKYYAGLLKIALENENVNIFFPFGLSDRDASYGGEPGYGNPFILDKNFSSKPAYYAMLELLKSY